MQLNCICFCMFKKYLRAAEAVIDFDRKVFKYKKSTERNTLRKAFKVRELLNILNLYKL